MAAEKESFSLTRHLLQLPSQNSTGMKIKKWKKHIHKAQGTWEKEMQAILSVEEILKADY